MKIEATIPTQADHEEMRAAGLDPEVCLADRVKLICRDDNGHEAVSFMERERFDRLGLAYIEAHAELEYIRFLDCWHMSCSENDWHNDPERNPEKVIQVRFVKSESRPGREVYLDTEGRCYIREVSDCEPFAKWYICGRRRAVADGIPPKANTIFRHGSQQEKVVFQDWNGVAAYRDQFNASFSAGAGPEP